MFYLLHRRNAQLNDGATARSERSRRSDEIGDAVLHDARKRQTIHGVIFFLHVLRDRQITQLLQRQIPARALADGEFRLRRGRTDQRE